MDALPTGPIRPNFEPPATHRVPGPRLLMKPKAALLARRVLESAPHYTGDRLMTILEQTFPEHVGLQRSSASAININAEVHQSTEPPGPLGRSVRKLWESFKSQCRSVQKGSLNQTIQVPADNSRRSRMQQIRELLAHLEPHVDTAMHLHQLFELTRLLRGYNELGDKVGEDLAVHYTLRENTSALFNIWNHRDKLNTVNQAIEVLEAHLPRLKQCLLDFQSRSPSPELGRAQAQAAFALIPAPLLASAYLPSLGLETPRGVVGTCHTLMSLVNNPDESAFLDTQTMLERLHAYERGTAPDSEKSTFDPLLILDAVVDYRNAETGERHQKSYRMMK